MYRMCSQAWYFKYKEKYDTPEQGASLSFGNAVDVAVERYLNGANKDYIKVFDEEWLVSTNMFGAKTQVFDNDNILYAHSDFDADVLAPEDFEQMKLWSEELKLYSEEVTSLELFKHVAKAKKNPYKKIKENQLKYFNRCSWLSLKRKGHLMLHSFVEQFVPKIEKVISVQKNATIVSDDKEDTIGGKIDLILKLKNFDKPIIFDLKTAGRPYKQDNIDNSEQLTLYLAMEGAKHDTDLVGYVVLSKAINKDKVSYCKSCGYKKDGSHRKCNNIVEEGDRCNGEWEEKSVINPQVQVLIEKKTDQQMNFQLEVETQTLDSMKAGIVTKNPTKCNSWFGNKCPFIDLCHKNDPTGLVKRS